MTFEELDKKMRVFETAHDHCILPGLYIVAREEVIAWRRRIKTDVHLPMWDAYSAFIRDLVRLV